MTGRGVQFIWPPFIASDILPLGIPSLAAYLKSKGFRDFDVLDLNMAYLKKQAQPAWSFYTLMRRAGDVVKKSTGDPSGHLLRFFQDRSEDVMNALEANVKKSVPWSLASMLDALRPGLHLREKAKISALLKSACKKKPAWVCVSVNYPEQLFFALLIVDELRRALPGGTRIVLGGAQVTKHIDLLVQSGVVRRLFDFLVVKDGEEPIFRLASGGPESRYSDIPNLYYKDPRTGAFVYSGASFVMRPDDFLAPDFSGFDLAAYSPRLPLIASRGCPWGRCVFCTYSTMHDRTFRLASVGKMIDIIEQMKKTYGAADFAFFDDGLQARFMRELSEALIQKEISISWMTGIILSPDFADPAFCRLLKKAGLLSVSFGLESISRRLLKLMDKYHQNLPPEEIVDMLRAIKDEGIEVSTCVFFGFPTETQEEAQKTVDFLTENIALFDGLRVQSFCLEDHNALCVHPELFGISKICHDDKNAGRRLGYHFEVKEGLNREEAARFADHAARLLLRELRKKRR